MKPVSDHELPGIADQLERTARMIREHGPEALRRAGEWSGPSTLRANGYDPGRGKGQAADPVGIAGVAGRVDRDRELALLLAVEFGQCFDAAVGLESRISDITTNKVKETDLAGIGLCENGCGHRCDGSPNNRLRLGLCENCYRKANRADKPCSHPKQRWSNGVVKCMTCGAALTEAGVEAG